MITILAAEDPAVGIDPEVLRGSLLVFWADSPAQDISRAFVLLVGAADNVIHGSSLGGIVCKLGSGIRVKLLSPCASC